ncbi:MAG TPA: DUF881 domain-containing protein [Acidimicrobiales bacterium]|nr:DUF881 domain-containing protein [Acidimicrobiales bacterium]
MTAPMTVGGRRTVMGGPVLVLLVAALIGFLLVSRLRGEERFTQRLEAESEEDLARILAGLTAEADALREEVSGLRVQLAELEAGSRSDEAASQSAEQQLQALEVLAGTVPVTGPGVMVRVLDPERSVTYDSLIDVVQELRDAGAEAVAVNNRRVGANSAFGEDDRVVTLDGSPLAAPYHVAAIGQPATLEGGLEIPGGALDTLGALKGVEVSVQRMPKVDIPALAKAPAFRVARPVGSGS